jgi:hypothetical protein
VCEVLEGAGVPLSFGAYLKQSRVLRELTLDEVARATKLPARIVAALEADDWKILHDPKYAQLAARSVATAIGLDQEETALRLEEALLPAEPPPGRAPRWRRLWDACPREPWVWAVVCATLLACAVLLLRR